MIKGLKKLLICFITLLIVFFSIKLSVVANNDTSIEKVYCETSIEQAFSENEILIVLNKEISKDLNFDLSFEGIEYLHLEDLTSSYDTQDEMNENFRRIYKMTLNYSSKAKVLETIKELEKIDYIYSVEPNYLEQASATPNDYSPANQYGVAMMNLDEAWDLTTGSRTVTVGIIDSGIDGDHPDLQENINTDLSRNFSPYFTDPLDDISGHGTFVAGIIGAVGNNGIGITGVNWNVSLVSLRVANLNGDFLVGSVIEAINYANEDGVKIDILNYSGGGYGYGDVVVAREQAISNYNGLFVCAAGNDAIDTDINLHYPSSHNLPNLISVGALDSDGDRRAKSNYGLNTVKIYAPGGYIYSTTIDNSYGYNSGTSFAAPQVAGVAALLLSLEEDLTTEQLKTAILESAEIITITIPGGGTQSAKKLDAHNALMYVLNNYHEHSYICTYKDARTHTATCACGDQLTLMHWIKESELTGGRYGRCADCGARIDLGNSFVPVGPFAVATKITANGSYILPNGIAVIVDADVEAYINGTLVFYDPDDLPVTQ